LQVTFSRGRPIVAYYYFPAKLGRRKSHHTRYAAPGFLVDFDRTGRPIGIEIVEPRSMTLRELNRALRGLGLRAMRRIDLTPVLAA